VPHFPRLRALALFGRRPPQLVDSLVMPASENLHRTGLMQQKTLFTRLKKAVVTRHPSPTTKLR
jgi:hypothetical protein